MVAGFEASARKGRIEATPATSMAETPKVRKKMMGNFLRSGGARSRYISEKKAKNPPFSDSREN
jgi:hypothetical protein